MPDELPTPTPTSAVSREQAIEIVERHLNRWWFGADRPEPSDHPGRLVVLGTEEHRLGWFVYIQSARYAETRDFRDMAIGAGYFLVDGLDGSLHHMHASADREHGGWIEDYLEDVRGVPRPDPLKAETQELLRAGNRFAALRAVRRAAPDLDPAGAKRYVDAIATGAPIPEDVGVRLPRYVPPIFAVRTAVACPDSDPA